MWPTPTPSIQSTQPMELNSRGQPLRTFSKCALLWNMCQSHLHCNAHLLWGELAQLYPWLSVQCSCAFRSSLHACCGRPLWPLWGNPANAAASMQCSGTHAMKRHPFYAEGYSQCRGVLAMLRVHAAQLPPLVTQDTQGNPCHAGESLKCSGAHEMQRRPCKEEASLLCRGTPALRLGACNAEGYLQCRGVLANQGGACNSEGNLQGRGLS